MSVVRIPPVLRGVVGGSRELPAADGTVAEVLDGLFASHPALADRLRPDGTLSAFVNVYINGDDIRHREGFETRVTADDVVILLPAMAGGCSSKLRINVGALDNTPPGRLRQSGATTHLAQAAGLHLIDVSADLPLVRHERA